jgi:hypothetical protein
VHAMASSINGPVMVGACRSFGGCGASATHLLIGPCCCMVGVAARCSARDWVNGLALQRHCKHEEPGIEVWGGRKGAGCMGVGNRLWQ